MLSFEVANFDSLMSYLTTHAFHIWGCIHCISGVLFIAYIMGALGLKYSFLYFLLT